MSGAKPKPPVLSSPFSKSSDTVNRHLLLNSQIRVRAPTRGEIRTKTHDYTRHGTITLFAALNYLDGKLIARTEQQHTHVEWLRFLKQIERETPKELDLHLIVDNYCTHKEENVRKWLQRHPRFHLHFTPTGSSWLNLIERFFGELTQDVIKGG